MKSCRPPLLPGSAGTMVMMFLLPLLLAQPPISIHSRSNVLRRMPMFYGKRASPVEAHPFWSPSVASETSPVQAHPLWSSSLGSEASPQGLGTAENTHRKTAVSSGVTRDRPFLDFTPSRSNQKARFALFHKNVQPCFPEVRHAACKGEQLWRAFPVLLQKLSRYIQEKKQSALLERMFGQHGQGRGILFGMVHSSKPPTLQTKRYSLVKGRAGRFQLPDDARVMIDGQRRIRNDDENRIETRESKNTLRLNNKMPLARDPAHYQNSFSVWRDDVINENEKDSRAMPTDQKVEDFAKNADEETLTDNFDDTWISNNDAQFFPNIGDEEETHAEEDVKNDKLLAELRRIKAVLMNKSKGIW